MVGTVLRHDEENAKERERDRWSGVSESGRVRTENEYLDHLRAVWEHASELDTRAEEAERFRSHGPFFSRPFQARAGEPLHDAAPGLQQKAEL